MFRTTLHPLTLHSLSHAHHMVLFEAPLPVQQNTFLNFSYNRGPILAAQFAAKDWLLKPAAVLKHIAMPRVRHVSRFDSLLA
jgi:hypothetical protein